MNRSSTRRSFFKRLTEATALGALATEALGTSQLSAAAFSGTVGEEYVNPKRVLLWESTRKEIREGLRNGRMRAAIIPTGATEQHNEHLALICDTACATLVAQHAALRLYPQVIVSTPCPVGWSPYHMARPGTLTIQKETFLSYVHDLITSLKFHGFRTIYIVNGHAGNHDLLQQALPGWREKFKITLDANSYWNGYTEEDLKKYLQSGAGVSHAAEFETSLLLAAFPDRVRQFTMKEYDAAHLDFDQNPPTYPGWGVTTRPGENARDRTRQEQALLATVEKGQILFSLAMKFVAGKLARMIAATEAGTPWTGGS